MKAKELIIGDWVNATCFNGKRVLPQEKLQINSIDNVDKGFLIVEPIPLTSEILEANGFEIMRTIHGDELCRTYKIAGRNLNYCFMYGDDKDVAKVTDPLLTGEIYFYVMYVHELQHALRLCGLSEMADNFKLTKKGDNDNE